jgi:hypothetical protein
VMDAQHALLVEAAHRISPLLGFRSRGQIKRITRSYTFICTQMNNPS